MHTVDSQLRKPDPLISVCLPDLIAEQVRLQGDAVAVVSDERCLTFSQLDQLARRLAGRLRALGVADEECVGLYVDTSPELVAGTWAILFAGAAYLPLAPDYPEDRLRFMIDDSGVRLIVTQEHLADRARELAPQGTRIVTLSDSHDGPAASTNKDLPSVKANSLAYVIYTSGSTGRPKGVMIEHRSVMSQLRWLRACMGVGHRSTVLQKTPMSFDAAQWEILACAVGSRVVVGPRDVHRDPEALIETVTRHHVTMLQCVPTLLQALLDSERFGECDSLETVFSGGEALTRSLAGAVTDQLPGAALVNLYGPTECTINSTACLIDPDSLEQTKGTVSIGVPVDNTQCYILDSERKPVDIGEPGELYIGGAQLARGYLNRPEQTRERFVASPFVPTDRLYRTGDLAYWNPDGTIQFSGRVDHQVKLRGHRVELEEVASAIEEHLWVKHAVALVVDDDRTRSQQLVACVELNAKEAALMDQGNHGGHHQSKSTRLQVRAQLSDPGLREPAQLAARPRVALPGRRETPTQRQEVFARKTYRFYEGNPVTRKDLLELLAPQPAGGISCSVATLTLAELGTLMRWFGQFRAADRLLPKYAYASPGALYATQLYLELAGIGGIPPGYYYYHPVEHSLIEVRPLPRETPAVLQVHFVGKRSAIEPVYRNNIREVLEFEAGHMVGVFERALADLGLRISPADYEPDALDALDVAESDYYLGSFAIGPRAMAVPAEPLDVYLQAQPGRVSGLAAGFYRYSRGELEHVSDEVVRSKDVIAINQQVFDRASFGVSLVSRPEAGRRAYVYAGLALHRLQRNRLGIGLMSSGYSSETGSPLPAARQIDRILSASGLPTGPSYFAVGGPVSEEQILSEGMREDVVHMKGPAEIIRDDLSRTLPHYMIPARVLVVDTLPLSANGKVDRLALAGSTRLAEARASAAYVAPATPTQRWLAQEWGRALKYQDVSAADDFFASGGNSLVAVALVHRINAKYGTELPLQIIFQFPKLADLAGRIDSTGPQRSSRLVRLSDGVQRPVFCWPGLGGYPMNLRPLAHAVDLNRPFYGVQAHGINVGEEPHRTSAEMATADLVEILARQPEGPITLLGYSFGARIAFEAAWQLQQAGRAVDRLLLVCPGNPGMGDAAASGAREAVFTNSTYVRILFSVFTGTNVGPRVQDCLRESETEDAFVFFVHRELGGCLDHSTIRRIVRIVAQTYEFDCSFHELAERQLMTPVTIVKAAGDNYSFIEARQGYSNTPPRTIALGGDHYSVLAEHGVAELATAIRAELLGVRPDDLLNV